MSPPEARPIDARVRREARSYVNVLVLPSPFGAVEVPMAVMLPAPSYVYCPEAHSVTASSGVSLRWPAAATCGATTSGARRDALGASSPIDWTAGSPDSAFAA